MSDLSHSVPQLKHFWSLRNYNTYNWVWNRGKINSTPRKEMNSGMGTEYLEQHRFHPSHIAEWVCSDEGQRQELMSWESEDLEGQLSYQHIKLHKISWAEQLCPQVTFSPPDKLAIFFQLFFGGLTLKTTPSEKGSKESTNSSSASPPSVIICLLKDKDQKEKYHRCPAPDIVLKLFLLQVHKKLSPVIEKSR